MQSQAGTPPPVMRQAGGKPGQIDGVTMDVGMARCNYIFKAQGNAYRCKSDIDSDKLPPYRRGHGVCHNHEKEGEFAYRNPDWYEQVG